MQEEESPVCHRVIKPRKRKIFTYDQIYQNEKRQIKVYFEGPRPSNLLLHSPGVKTKKMSSFNKSLHTSEMPDDKGC